MINKHKIISGGTVGPIAEDKMKFLEQVINKQ